MWLMLFGLVKAASDNLKDVMIFWIIIKIFKQHFGWLFKYEVTYGEFTSLIIINIT